jgi:hypothetical protein
MDIHGNFLGKQGVVVMTSLKVGKEWDMVVDMRSNMLGQEFFNMLRDWESEVEIVGTCSVVKAGGLVVILHEVDFFTCMRQSVGL